MDHLWGLGKAWNQVDIQTEIGNLILELSFQKSQGKSVMLISTGLEICQSVRRVQVQFNPKFSIMQPSKEWTIVIVHTRISTQTLKESTTRQGISCIYFMLFW